MKASFADTDTMRESLPAIIHLLDGGNHNQALAALSGEARALPTAKERAEYFAAPFNAPAGTPKALHGMPKVVAWVALKGLQAMTSARGKLISTDQAFKDRETYNPNFYHDLIKAGIATDTQTMENFMVCFYDAAHEARHEDQPGGSRWHAHELLKNHLHASGLFALTRERSRLVLWGPLAPLLAVGGIGETVGIHPRTKTVSAALVS